MKPWIRTSLLSVATWPVAGLAIAALWPTNFWISLLALAWAPHLALLSLPLWCWVGRGRWPSLTMLTLLTIALWPWFSAVFSPRAEAPSANAASATMANLYYRSEHHAESLRRIDSDIVVLVECLPEDRTLLEHDPRWPYQRWALPKKWSGVAVLSRWPMTSTEMLINLAPLIDARIATPSGPLRLIGVHTWSPMSAKRRASHDAQLHLLAALLAAETGPILILGDLNSAPGDPSMNVLRQANLLPPAGGNPATWPWLLGPCGISIDHALGRRLKLGDAQAIPLDGSDHRGLRVRFEN
ncbi:MAG: endonuclease/exonuclease/phosphatase family protein [Planctomycetota bacterium]